MKPVAALLLLLFSLHSLAQTQPSPSPTPATRLPSSPWKPLLYQSRLIPLTTPAIVQKRPLELNHIFLPGATPPLQEAVVTAFRPAIHQEIDRISYDVQADPESKSNDALEMLRKVPMVTVDGNDQIQLKGSGNYLIFLNGKPSALMTNNPADVLKSLPAAAIQKIEVITVPPAKYDAEGVVGIINIITVKKTEEGYNATIFGRYNNILGERGSISFNAKAGKWGLNALLGAAHQPYQTTAGGSGLTTEDPASNLSQQGQNVNGADIRNGQAQLNFDPDSLELFNGFIDFFDRHFTRNTFRQTQFFSPPDSLNQSYQLNNIGTGAVGAVDIGLSYQLNFRHTKNESLTLAWQYAGTTYDQGNIVTATDRYNYTGSNYSQQNNTHSTQHNFQLDFVKPIGNLSVEAGIKTSFTINYSDFAEQDSDLTSDQFNYHQDIYAAYNSYQLKLSTWTFKAGLRAENTRISPIRQDYTNVIPAISIQHTDPALGTFTLGFTDRIQRPVLQQLNPFIDHSNPDLLTTGNPDLRPVVNHIIELGFSRPGHTPINVSLNYGFADNTIQQVTTLLSDTVSESTWSNLGTTQSGGINVSTNLPVTQRLNLNLNAQFTHIWITGTYNGQFYRNDGNQGNANLFIRYNFTHGFTVNIDYGFESGNVLLQGSTTSYSFSTYNIIKEVLNKKATVSLTIYSPFKQYDTGRSYTNTPDFGQSSYTQYIHRMFRFALNYKFGHLKASASDKQPTE